LAGASEAARVRIKQEENNNNLNTLRSLKRGRQGATGDSNEVQAIAVRFKKRRVIPADEEIIELSD
jgi:hypothetical protein